MLRVLITKKFDLNEIKNAFLTKLLAKENNQGLVLKAYDIKADNIDKNLAYLSKFGFSFLKEVYTSANVSFYQNFAMRFLTQKIAFMCYCHLDNTLLYRGSCDKLNDNEVLAKEESFCIRVKKPIPNIDVQENGYTYQVASSDIDSFMLLYEDKTPTMTFANSIDDMLLDIDTIIRDSTDDILSAKEEYIRKLLNYPKQITYIHTPTIQNAPTIEELFSIGILPDTIINYIINTLTNSNDIKSIDEYESIDFNSIIKNDVKFCMQTLKALNKQHIKKINSLILAKSFGYYDKDIGELAKVLDYDNTIDIQSVLSEIFAPKQLDDTGKQIANITKEKFCNTYEEYILLLENKINLDKKVIKKTLSDIICNRVDLEDIYPYIKNYLMEIIK